MWPITDVEPASNISFCMLFGSEAMRRSVEDLFYL